MGIYARMTLGGSRTAAPGSRNATIRGKLSHFSSTLTVFLLLSVRLGHGWHLIAGKPVESVKVNVAAFRSFKIVFIFSQSMKM